MIEAIFASVFALRGVTGRRSVVEGSPVPPDLTRHLGLRGEPQDGSQQGALTRAIGTDHCRQLSAVNVQIHPAKDRHVSYRNRKIFDFCAAQL